MKMDNIWCSHFANKTDFLQKVHLVKPMTGAKITNSVHFLLPS